MPATSSDISVRIPRQLQRRLKAIATAEGRDMSAIVIAAIRADLSRARRKAARKILP